MEQRSGPLEPDVLAIESQTHRWPLDSDAGGVATQSPPVTSIVRRTSKEIFAGRANRIVVRHHLGRILAIIEIVSPGNKDTRAALENFVSKTIQFLRKRIHVLVIDPFPPTLRDPLGIHKVIWDELEDEPFEFPPRKDRILVSYQAGDDGAAYIEPIAVGDPLPDMPLFLAESYHVPVPLEATYQATWAATPEELRRAVETGVLPDAGAES